MEDGTLQHQPIRVLQVIGIVCGGGVEAVIMNYYRHIDRNRVQFDFVIDGYEESLLDEEIKKLGGRVYHVEPYRKNILKTMYQLYRIIKDNHYDIVHSNMNTLSVFALFPAWLAGTKVRILHNHSTAVKHEGMRTVMKKILRPLSPLFANRYAACSRLAGEWMYGKKMMESGKVKIINNAIDLNEYAFNESLRQKYRKELAIEENAFVVGHVGRFMYQKNHAFLIDIFAEIVKKKVNAILFLIGDGPLRQEMEEKVKAKGLTDKVKFLGLRKDVKALYNVMDVFVLPSWYEGLPVVSVEAQANGLPCFLSDMITPEAKLISSTRFLSIESEAGEWSKVIIKSNPHRCNVKMEMEHAGFDIDKECETLQNMYQTDTILGIHR